MPTRSYLMELHTCNCPHCKGRASVCMNCFDWVDKKDPNHTLRHAQEDLLTYFDRLPAEVKAALAEADVNVCSWCADIWIMNYGAASAAQIIRAVRFIDDTHAVVRLEIDRGRSGRRG